MRILVVAEQLGNGDVESGATLRGSVFHFSAFLVHNPADFTKRELGGLQMHILENFLYRNEMAVVPVFFCLAVEIVRS